jgi:hypothetical protein
MSEHTEINYSLMLNTELTYGELRKIEIIFMRVLGYIRRLAGGNEDLAACIEWIQKTIMWLRQMQMMIHAIEIASGPIGWAYAAVTVVGMAFTTTDMMYDTVRCTS